MGSKKRANWSRQKAEFNASLGGDLFGGSSGADDAFAREGERRRRQAEDADAARRHRGCEKKNRYASRTEAEAAIASCADWGTTGLSCYHCPYCNGWHLTSHPWE